MTYFVTGATGFIGRHLVERLLERDGDIHVLVREGSRGQARRAARELGPPARPRQARGRRPHAARAGRGRRRAQGQGRPLLPPGRDLRHGGRRGAQRAAQRRRHAERDRPGQRAGGRALPPHVLDRRRRALRRGHVQRGHVRRGPEAGPPLPPHEVRVGEARPRAGQEPVARVPAVARRRQLADRRDGQGRRALLLLQGHQADPPRAAGVVPAGLGGVGLDEPRAGRLRRRRGRPHRPPGRARRPGLPHRRSEGPARRRRAEHVRQRRARAARGDADRPPGDGQPAQGRAVVRHEAARAEADPRAVPGRPRDPRGGARLHRADLPLRRARHQAGAAGLRHRAAAAGDLLREAVGLLGARARPGPVQGPLVRGRGQRQDGGDHRRVVAASAARRR